MAIPDRLPLDEIERRLRALIHLAHQEATDDTLDGAIRSQR